jgi:alpha-glucosidase (family GH31 glycosyl hydrolase)
MIYYSKVWVKRPDGTPRVGAVWAGNSRFIDYSRPSAKIYWEYLLRKYKEDIDWDGLWLDMNEPANWGTGDNEFGCEDNNINHPPYMPGNN